MKFLPILLSLLALAFACSQPPETTQTPTTPIQSFTINASSDTTITTASGLKITIPAGSLVNTDSTTVTGPIDINIKEIVTKSDMILNNISTAADGKLIESLSMFHFDATSNERELIVNGALTATIPKTTSQRGWGTFYGVENDSIVEWEQEQVVQETLVIAERAYGPPDTLLYERDLLNAANTELPDSLLTNWNPDSNTIYFYKLGWINCDRFIDMTNSTPLTISSRQIHQSHYYIVFEQINSVVQEYFERPSETTTPIPPGYNVTVLVVDQKDDQYSFASRQFVTGTLDSISFDPKPISKEDLLKEFTKLDSPKK